MKCNFCKTMKLEILSMVTIESCDHVSSIFLLQKVKDNPTDIVHEEFENYDQDENQATSALRPP